MNCLLGIFGNWLFGAQTGQTGLRVGGLQGSDSVSARHPPLKPLPDPIPLKIQFPVSNWHEPLGLTILCLVLTGTVHFTSSSSGAQRAASSSTRIVR